MANLRILRESVLVAGANGLLGQKMVEVLHDSYHVHGIGMRKHACCHASDYTYSQCDVTASKEVKAIVSTFEPRFIVNCAAFSSPDSAEIQRELCWKINVAGLENIINAARAAGSAIVQISTDHVFGGGDEIQSEESPPCPVAYYGRSKLAAENAVIASGLEWAIVRTMILYGTGAKLRHNFATDLIEKLQANSPVNIADDQWEQPTLVDDLASGVKKIIELRKTGIFHVSGPEYISRYDFALKLAAVFDFDLEYIKPTKTPKHKHIAVEPRMSKFRLLKAQKELGIKTRDIQQGLDELKRQLQAQVQAKQ